jgi:hypothetical protein
VGAHQVSTPSSASGSGISFPATQSASSDANTLDDYEEGTWTPTVNNMTTTGTPAYAVAHIQKLADEVTNLVFILQTKDGLLKRNQNGNH